MPTFQQKKENKTMWLGVFFLLSLYITYKKNAPHQYCFHPFFYLAKKSPPFPSDFPTNIFLKIGLHVSFCRYLWLSVMHNKVIPPDSKILGFLQNFFIADIFFWLFICIHQKKAGFLVFAKIGWVKEGKFTSMFLKAIKILT